jgi:aspartyl/asparaginyl-tRNA synthetase
MQYYLADACCTRLLLIMQKMQPSSDDAGEQQQQVEVRGWIRTVRQQKQFAFMQVGLLMFPPSACVLGCVAPPNSTGGRAFADASSYSKHVRAQ